MIKGTPHRRLDTDEILKYISEYDIFMYYMGGRKWVLGKKTHSPFHEDRDPSFLIGNRYGSLRFIDFSNTDKRGDCFDFVQMLYGMQSLNEALEKIDSDFGLGIRRQKTEKYKEIVKSYPKPDIESIRNNLIQVKVRNFTQEELAYWNMYHQDISDLKENKIYSLDTVFLNRRRLTLKKTELRFGYFYNGKWKIYTPFAQDRNNKWFPNNVPITEMDGKQNLVPTMKAFVNKSKKDYMVMRKIYPWSCAVQNEGIACFSEENVKFIAENSAGGIISFDSDEPGVKNSLLVTSTFGYDYCNVPKKLQSSKIKDWAEWARIEGMEKIENYLKEKGIL